MKVIFDLSAQRISIEGDGPEVVDLLKLAKELAPKIPEITLISGPAKATSNSHNAGGNGAPPVDQPTQTMRQFVKRLSLTNTAERVAAVAFYLKKVGRPTFSPKEMGALFTQCGLSKPTKMPVAVFESKRRFGYVESTGYGAWSIAPEGENMIVRKMEEAGEVE